MKIFREYVIAVVSSAVTVILTLIATFILQFEKEIIYITFATGTIITLTATLIKKELENIIKDKINKSLEPYRLIDEIDDKLLKEEIFNLARSLNLGEVPPHIAAIRSKQLLEQSKNIIYASDYNDELQNIYEWKNHPRLNTWYKWNLDAIRRGVSIKRTFILRKNEVIKNNVWDNITLNILKTQSADGVKVRILWIEEIISGSLHPNRQILKDFVIFDMKEVQEFCKNETRIYRQPSKRVQEFIEILEEQKKFSRTLEEILDENN